jgi:hypothetical protein
VGYLVTALDRRRATSLSLRRATVYVTEKGACRHVVTVDSSGRRYYVEGRRMIQSSRILIAIETQSYE